MKTALEALVKAETITQAQEDAITAGRGQEHDGAHHFGKKRQHVNNKAEKVRGGLLKIEQAPLTFF